VPAAFGCGAQDSSVAGRHEALLVQALAGEHVPTLALAVPRTKSTGLQVALLRQSVAAWHTEKQ
jgi:hypothetical protein